MDRSLFWLLGHDPASDPPHASTLGTAIEHARLADELGYRGLWLAEHHFQTLGTTPNPAVTLAAIAARTRALRLGPAVAVLPLRDPIQVAEDYALVDLLSGGRLDLGVGTGSQPLEFEGLGVDFDRRRELFEQRLPEVRARWAAAASGERGPRALNVAPVQSPPPVFVATMSEESALRIGRAGDSMLTLVSPATSDPGEVAARVAAHARGLDDGGHPPGSTDAVVVLLAHVAETESEARAVGAPALGRLIGEMAGVELEHPGELYDGMRERGTGVFGAIDDVDGQLARWSELGADHVAFLTGFGGMDAAAAEGSLRGLAPRA